MFLNYLIVFLISMVPIIELRGAIPVAVGMGLDPVISYIICIIGNMLPVPIIYFFARKVLIWGKDKKYIGKFFTFCIEKGEKVTKGQTIATVGDSAVYEIVDESHLHFEILKNNENVDPQTYLKY